MNTATVGFVYNAPCPLQCNFCCHTQENVGPGRASPENVLPAILRFAKEPSVTNFAFTGGDPFVYYAEILQILKGAHEAGVRQPFRIVTSGFWAKSLEIARSRLEPLMANGMSQLCLSYDHEHARWVSPQQIAWIREACCEMGLTLSISSVFWSPEEKLSDLLQPMPEVSCNSHLVTSIGRARSLVGENPRYNLPDETKYSCHQARTYDITIYPNGDTYPCCSGGFNKEAGLYCGNAFAETSETILTRVYTLFHARIAKEIGFDRLYQRVAERDPALHQQMPRFDAVDSACQVCRNLRTQPGLQQALAPIYEELEIEYALACIDDHDARLNLFQPDRQGAHS